MIPNSPSGWLSFSSRYLFCGRETAGALPISGGGLGTNPPPSGVWMIPLEPMDAEIARQRKAQQEHLAQSAVQAKQNVRTLLEKFDRNRNGVIDLEEREDALDDPDFIRAELRAMDTNHDGWLEAPELAYFDANQNKILDPKEQAGIDLAEHFLAEEILNQFDGARKGWLQRNEYDRMVESTLHVNDNVDFDLIFAHADANHDGHVDLDEIEYLLKVHTKRTLRMQRQQQSFRVRPMAVGAPLPDEEQIFKADVESYWENPGGNFGRPGFQRPPMGGGFFPGQMPNNPSP